MTTGTAVSAMALVTLMSLVALGHTPEATRLLHSASQQSVRVNSEDEAQGWISCLAQAAKSLRGGPRLPDSLSATFALGSQSSTRFTFQQTDILPLRDHRLPGSRPVLHCHLTDIPPPPVA